MIKTTPRQWVNDRTTPRSRQATTTNRGCYLLVIFLKNPVTLRIMDKEVEFPSGFYIYVGSAMNSLTERVKRHLKIDKKKRWHIDYLLEYSRIVACILLPGEFKIECEVASTLRGKIICEKFGSTDCSCKTHLFYYSNAKEVLNEVEKVLNKFAIK